MVEVTDSPPANNVVKLLLRDHLSQMQNIIATIIRAKPTAAASSIYCKTLQLLIRCVDERLLGNEAALLQVR